MNVSTAECASLNVQQKEAILPDTDDKAAKWTKLNEEFSEQWPNIVKKAFLHSDGDKFKDEEDKFSKYFSKNPGSGSLE